MLNNNSEAGLRSLGYDDFFASNHILLESPEHALARVIAEHKGVYKVKSANGEYLAKITGKQMFSAENREDYPAVGDWVTITELGQEKGIIHSILPRKTLLKKKYNNTKGVQVIATNIDVAFIVESLDRDYNLNRFERYVVLANEGGIQPVIILNKIDLISENELNERIAQIQTRFDGIEIIATSIRTERDLDALVNYITKGKTYCFLGSSGVGKSSLINKLLNTQLIKTGEISDSARRGKHTTTARAMYFLANGGIVIDNPGTREVGVIDASAGIEQVFDEITNLSHECKYADCTHTHEPGCAVQKAIENKEFDNEKYENYIKLKKENAFLELTDLDKRKKDRKFGQFIKKTLEQLKETEQ